MREAAISYQQGREVLAAADTLDAEFPGSDHLAGYVARMRRDADELIRDAQDRCTPHEFTCILAEWDR